MSFPDLLVLETVLEAHALLLNRKVLLLSRTDDLRRSVFGSVDAHMKSEPGTKLTHVTLAKARPGENAT